MVASGGGSLESVASELVTAILIAAGKRVAVAATERLLIASGLLPESTARADSARELHEELLGSFAELRARVDEDRLVGLNAAWREISDAARSTAARRDLLLSARQRFATAAELPKGGHTGGVPNQRLRARALVGLAAVHAGLGDDPTLVTTYLVRAVLADVQTARPFLAPDLLEALADGTDVYTRLSPDFRPVWGLRVCFTSGGNQVVVTRDKFLYTFARRFGLLTGSCLVDDNPYGEVAEVHAAPVPDRVALLTKGGSLILVRLPERLIAYAPDSFYTGRPEVGETVVLAADICAFDVGDRLVLASNRFLLQVPWPAALTAREASTHGALLTGLTGAHVPGKVRAFACAGSLSVVCTEDDGRIRIYGLPSEGCTARVLHECARWSNAPELGALTVAPNGTRVAVDNGEFISVLDVATAAPVARLAIPDAFDYAQMDSTRRLFFRPRRLRFSPDGQLLVTTYEDPDKSGTLTVHQLAAASSDRSKAPTLEAVVVRRGRWSDAAFSADGQHLAAVGEDLGVWRTSRLLAGAVVELDPTGKRPSLTEG